jgi:two-component system chemotaxis response regulator CheY
MLIVDDSAYIRTVIRVFAEKQGFKVVGEAENGRDGVASYKNLTPDIVTLDLVMDEQNGIDALKEIMAFDAAAEVAVISALPAKSPIIKEALELGAKKSFTKPLNEVEFMQYLKTLQ